MENFVVIEDVQVLLSRFCYRKTEFRNRNVVEILFALCVYEDYKI